MLEFLRRADRAWKSNVFDLSEMDLDILPLDIITLFPNITGLYVDNNAVSEIPFEFHVMTQLEELRFDQHLMRSPSMEIWELGIQRAMQFMRKFLGYRTDPRVDLRGWQLHAMPDEVFDIKLGPRVTLFDFSQNQLVALPAMIDTLTSLRELRLDENLMEKLPRCLCSLSSLHRLSVTRNRLRAFPKPHAPHAFPSLSVPGRQRAGGAPALHHPRSQSRGDLGLLESHFRVSGGAAAAATSAQHPGRR